jgi:hypothetical protein
VSEVPLSYGSLDEGYAEFAGTLNRNYKDVIGIHDPFAFLAAIQDDNGYKWNSVKSGY